MLEMRMQSLRKDLAAPGVLMTCRVCVCVLFRWVSWWVSSKRWVVLCLLGCVLCQCVLVVSLVSYSVLMVSVGCSVVLSVVFSVCSVALFVLLAIPS